MFSSVETLMDGNGRITSVSTHYIGTVFETKTYYILHMENAKSVPTLCLLFQPAVGYPGVLGL